MRLGAHLPLADLGGGLPTAGDLVGYATAARELGFATLAANDHLFWKRPWLDGPTALASVAAAAGDLTLATSLALPVVRHPVVVAKMLASLAALAQGPVVGGLGPGSSRVDLEAVGIPYDERWARFDEALRVVRALVHGEPTGPSRFYPATDGAGGWTRRRSRRRRSGSAAGGPTSGWRAMASVADGWFASAYNATPEQYAAARARLDGHLRAAGREPDAFPDAVATAWMYVTESRQEAERVLGEVLAPTLGRDPEQLAHLPVGSPEHCADALAAYAAAGARELLVWPVRDSLAQLERCAAVARSRGARLATVGEVTVTPWRPTPGSATGVGSLPGTEPREAAALVTGELPDLPHLPELPGRGPGADMVGRAGVAAGRPARRPPAVRLAAGRPARHGRAAGPQLPRPGPRRARGARRRVRRPGQGAGVRPVDRWRPRCSCPAASRCSPTPAAVRDLVASLAEGLLLHVARRAPPAPRRAARCSSWTSRRCRRCSPARCAPPPAATHGRAGRARPTPRTLLSALVAAVGVPVVVHCCAARPPVGAGPPGRCRRRLGRPHRCSARTWTTSSARRSSRGSSCSPAWCRRRPAAAARCRRSRLPSSRSGSCGSGSASTRQRLVDAGRRHPDVRAGRGVARRTPAPR